METLLSDQAGALSPSNFTQSATPVYDHVLSRLKFSNNDPIKQVNNIDIAVQDATPFIKDECTDFPRLYWPGFAKFEGEEYPGGSSSHHLRPRIAQEQRTASATKLMFSDSVPLLHTISTQVHNRSFDSSRESASTKIPCSRWTGSELTTGDEDQYSNIMALSLPSLISSRISSVQTDREDACVTPGLSSSSPLGLMRLLPNQPTPSNGSASESGHWISIVSNKNPSQSTEWSGIKVSGGDDVDWAQWSPTKFQCMFCWERFLVDSQLRDHLLTHKRYQRSQRSERKKTYLGSMAYSNLDTADQTLGNVSLAYRQLQRDSEHPKVALSGGVDSPKDSIYDGNTVHNSSSTQDISIPDRLQSFNAEDKDIANTTVKSYPASKSNAFRLEESISKGSRNFTWPRNLPSHLTLSSGTRANTRLPNERYVADSVCSENGKIVPPAQLDDDENTPIFDLEIDLIQHDSDGQVLPVLKSLLASIKQNIVARIMDEFMTILKQEWALRIRACGSDPRPTSGAAPPSGPRTSSRARTNNQGRQNGREDDDDEDPGDGEGDDDDQRAPKRPRMAASPILQDNAKYACPYRKNDPRKFCVGKWRSCALTPLDSIARVKAHLYRHHRIFQCQRCKCLFPNQNVLDEHILALQGCPPSHINLAEGITAEIEKKLRSRKKSYRHQTEPERWKEIYQTLFPAAILPSPFFEPIEEHVDQSSDSQKLVEFEDYTRRELPRVFWAALEEVVSNEMQPVEERLRNQLMGVIRDCQDRVFSTYESMLTSNIDSLPHGDSAKNTLSALFEPLCHSTSAQTRLSSHISHPSQSGTLTVTEANDSGLDVGYAGNISTVNSSATLSSIFDSSTGLGSIFSSSTTLSSIESSQAPAEIQPAATELPNEASVGTTCVFSANDKTMATTATSAPPSNDFWNTYLDGTYLSQFDMDNMWESRATTEEKFQ